MIILNAENLFLIIIAVVWIIGAIIQDFRRREVDNIWNFSLIGIVLAYRFGVSIFNGNYSFFLNGIFGFLIFLAIGNLFYYSRLFAGGDAKLLIALGPVLPLSYNWIFNFEIFGIFILLFLLGGSVYGIFYSFVLVARNWERFRQEFSKFSKKYKRMYFISFAFAIIIMGILFLMGETRLFLLGLIFLLFPVLYVFSKSIEESCLVKKIPAKKITIGDWLYKDIVINGKVIKAKWEGVSKKDLGLIRKCKKKILVKQGIPFTPSFLIGLVGLLVWENLGFFGFGG